MGNTESQPAQSAPIQEKDIRLFKGEVKGHTMSWVNFGEDVKPNFYNINEDTGTRQPEWHLEFEGSVEYPDTAVNNQFQFTPKDLQAIFLEGNVYWAIQFPDNSSYSRFSQNFNKCLFENTYGVEMNEENIEKELGYMASLEGGIEDDDSRAQWVEDMDVDTPAPGELTPRPQTSERLAARKDSALKSIIMGGYERSYVLSEEGIDVMKNTFEGIEDLDLSLSFGSMSIGGASTPGVTSRRRSSLGTISTPGSITPSKAILMDKETKLNMIAPDSSSLFSTDIERETVVNEFSFNRGGKDLMPVDIAPDTKHSQLESGSTFLAIAPKSISRWDMRIKGGIAQDLSSPVALSYDSGRDYKTNTNFTCVATSGDGYRVVGSKDGIIRLYNDKLEQTAKTNIPSLGAPIESVDVTYDGKWVVATTKSFLIVIKTFYKDGGKELCGFTSRLGRKAPAPRLLRLKPQDVMLTKGAPLTGGKFTWVTESGHHERHIIASCGNYTVRWNFRTVKLAEPELITNGLTTITNYKLIDSTEQVVDTTFMHEKYSRGHDPSMVVLTKSRLFNLGERTEEEVRRLDYN